MPITFASWNVNGIRAREAQFLEWVRRDQPDVICLQEIKAAPEKISETVCNLEGYWCYWHGAGGYSGVGLNLRRDTCPEREQLPNFRQREPKLLGVPDESQARHALRRVLAIAGLRRAWLNSDCSLLPTIGAAA